jgi:hypothetical protein
MKKNICLVIHQKTYSSRNLRLRSLAKKKTKRRQDLEDLQAMETASTGFTVYPELEKYFRIGLQNDKI